MCILPLPALLKPKVPSLREIGFLRTVSQTANDVRMDFSFISFSKEDVFVQHNGLNAIGLMQLFF